MTETLQADGDDSDLREGPQQGRCESDRKILQGSQVGRISRTCARECRNSAKLRNRLIPTHKCDSIQLTDGSRTLISTPNPLKAIDKEDTRDLEPPRFDTDLKSGVTVLPTSFGLLDAFRERGESPWNRRRLSDVASRRSLQLQPFAQWESFEYERQYRCPRESHVSQLCAQDVPPMIDVVCGTSETV